MSASRAPWRDIATLTIEAVGLYVIARWAWQQLAAAGRDLAASVDRYHARRDAIARASMPRSVPR